MGDSGSSVSLQNPGLTLTMSASKAQREYSNYISETPPGSPPPGTSAPNYQLNIQTYNKQLQTQKLEEANLVTPETSPEHDLEVETYCRNKPVGVYHGLSAVFDDWTPRGLTPPATDSERQTSNNEDRATAVASTSAANCGQPQRAPIADRWRAAEEAEMVAAIHSFFPTLFGPSKENVTESPMSEMFEQTSSSKLALLSDPQAELAAVCVKDEWEDFPNRVPSPPLMSSPSRCPFLSASSQCPESPPSLVPSMNAVWNVDSIGSASAHTLGNISGWETATPFELDLLDFNMSAVAQLLEDEEMAMQQAEAASPVKVVEQHPSPVKKCMRPAKKGKRSKMSRHPMEESSASDRDVSQQSRGPFSLDAASSSPPMLVASTTTSKNSPLTGGPDVRIHSFVNNELPTDHDSYCAPAKTLPPAPVPAPAARKFQQSSEGAIVVVKEANGKLNTTVAGPCPADFGASNRLLAQMGQQRKRKAMFAKPTGTVRISKATQAKRSRPVPNAEEVALLAKREKHKLSERQRRYKSAQGILQAQNYIVQTRGKDYFVNKACQGRTNKVKKISKQSTLDTCKKLILELQASPTALLCDLCERTGIVVSKFNQLCAERRQLEAGLGHIGFSDTFSDEFDLLTAQLSRLRKRLHLFQSRSAGSRVGATN